MTENITDELVRGILKSKCRNMEEPKDEVEDVGKKEHEKYAAVTEMEGSQNTEEVTDESDGEESSVSGSDDQTINEVPLTDAEIEGLVAELLEVESKAAEAQESLEKESIARVECEVREELAQNLHGDALEMAVSTEMKTFIEEWEAVLDDLETQSSLLLEQLDGAGIELPTLYKWIETQAPDVCSTEAWKKRAHWVGSQVTSELTQSVRDAENYLQSCHPVRRKHGKLLEEGASGFLTKKLSIEDKHNIKENPDKDWGPFNEIVQSGRCSDNNSFGSKNWASVYLANTPQEAADLGITLPGIDEVREEDDASLTMKLQRRLKRQRQRSLKQEANEKGIFNEVFLKECSQTHVDDAANTDNGNNLADSSKANILVSDGIEKQNPNVNDSCKRSHDGDDMEADNKKCRTVVIDSDDEVQLVNLASDDCHVPNRDAHLPPKGKVVDIIDVDILPSPCLSNQKLCRRGDERNFHCTACYESLRASEVRRHPLLQVIVCETCSLLLEERMNQKNLADFCQWCGKCNDLLSCNSCEMLFCTICISRNLGEECLLQAKASGWQCVCCSPVLLNKLALECENAFGGSVVSSSDSDIDLTDATDNQSNRRRRKKRIRRILDDAELGEETKQKIAMEKARQEHLKSMQVQSASKSSCINISSLSGNVACVTKDMMGDPAEGYIVNVAREEHEEPVKIPPSISRNLKPHQVAGVRFMWENIIQSVRKVKSGDKGLGCILAHMMGLGKTFQVITFLYTAMRTVNLGLKTALIVTPVNVLHNWKYEFLKWKPVELKPLRILLLEDVPRDQRAFYLAKWRDKGGILLIGYSAFRSLSLGRHVKDRNTANEICHALQYGPDILVCDEAHMIKNAKADITYALKQVKTQRRIALTGSPLQNNLMEYYCMVDFVREGFLGSSLEFRNRFQNPIENGQHTNSTAEDVKLMNERSHILYEQLKGFVQRMDMNVVKNDLPPKTVFVITVKLSSLQRKMYRKCLEERGLTGDKVSSEKTRCFFACYQTLSQILNHPGLLQMAKEHRYNLKREDAVENFLVDDSSSDDNIENGDLFNGEKEGTKQDAMPRKSNGIFSHEEVDWWEEIIDGKIYDEASHSGKMVLLLDILSMSSEAGDKALVFSQSLTTLDMIEQFLSRLPRKGIEDKYWRQGKDWYRIDGSTDGSERQKLVERFNEPTNRRVKCTLISTRAGSLGINLHAANRVILVDGSWNPTYDLQAIFRAWRYGQNKPVYAYRLMSHRTMEEKIYKRIRILFHPLANRLLSSI
ncbi:uncharacterized protein A4U43_C04F3010 [Asparagus officinalis]|uniref:ATP-dependent helicase ATRX n=1 Tax=Asparagus officinalis TaxID=4686 RepID=A0A5P1EZM3_ASPOF|nr:uncharacterized protein A4U43_C04F3010 [Asparagus officinalis]